jgi:hypothetical protein
LTALQHVERPQADRHCDVLGLGGVQDLLHVGDVRRRNRIRRSGGVVPGCPRPVRMEPPPNDPPARLIRVVEELRESREVRIRNVSGEIEPRDVEPARELRPTFARSAISASTAARRNSAGSSTGLPGTAAARPARCDTSGCRSSPRRGGPSERSVATGTSPRYEHGVA